MKKFRRGFTLVEVGLFLAVTGMLFVGIVMGVQGSMFQQRYNDSVQSFADFLRSIYSQTSNIESQQAAGGGRTGKAIYGKLVTFGEELNLEGQSNNDKAIFIYTIVGEADGDIKSGDVLNSLYSVNANVFIDKGDSHYGFAGIVDQYIPRWSAGIQTTEASPYEDFKGALLIIRHPRSGTVFTYVLEGNTIEINSMKSEMSMPQPLSKEELEGKGLNFKIEDVDFCVNPEPEKASSVRRDVRIIAGARNSSGVELVGQDDDTEGVGNRCK